ncbi:GerAB/ArcD/ProY family transporter [Lihuaxuella thermophila]|uniref:Spore germination protein KB n=1 Tax=Lihuaxuella thermophila TaxID=1173111 RepID=A0A1H8E938_9BACL|nr:GerAB/ArcD/ProY family transporter [Lihuaxuella thermophila]SEN16101.1 spore germination protein KB [Lihuaxuella thermophila]
MENARINVYQLFCLIILLELGSAVIVGLGIKAKQDAWIAVLVGLIGGLLLFLVYGSLHRQFPDLPLTGIIQRILGKFLGWPVAFIYVIYFLYIAARVLRDMSVMIVVAWLDRTPLTILTGMSVLAICYVLHHGIGVLAKTGEFFCPFYLFSILLSLLLILFSGLVNLENLRPVAEDWKRIFVTAYPLILTFPFGEMIVFTMLLPYVRQPKAAVKTGLLAMIFSALILSAAIVMDIATVGENVVGRAPFPFLATLGKVDIAEFLQRIDIIAVFILIVGGFFKVAIFFYVALMGISSLFQVKKPSRLVYPMGTILFFLSLIIASNFSEHIQEGLAIVPWVVHLPLQVGVPLFLWMLSLLTKRFNKRDQHLAGSA